MSNKDDIDDKPDGTYEYYDEQGNKKEGWLPPERIEKILKEHGAKKLTKVLIKGPWEDVKEDYWDINDKFIKKYADDDGIVYIMCYFEKGEPKYSFINKQLWLNMDEIGKIITNTQLSEEEKAKQIAKLKEIKL